MSQKPINVDQEFVRWLFDLAKERPVSLLDIVPDLTQTDETVFHGPCPFCQDGVDRFVVWLAEEPAYGGRFYCRQCGKTGNGIHFLRQVWGWGFSMAQDLFTQMSAAQREAPSLPLLPRTTSGLQSEHSCQNSPSGAPWGGEGISFPPSLSRYDNLEGILWGFGGSAS